MTVTELALLKLKSGDGTPSELVRAELLKAKEAMQSFSGRTFYYLQQIEDPNCIYVLGEWSSLSQHYEEFIPSQANKDSLEALKDALEVQWLSHLDVPIKDIALTAPVLSLVRHIVDREKRESFQNTFTAKRKYLQEYITEGNIAGGWKLEEDRTSEEFVLFAPWTAVEQHIAFASTHGFEEYGQIRKHIADADIKHVKVLDLRQL